MKDEPRNPLFPPASRMSSTMSARGSEVLLDKARGGGRTAGRFLVLLAVWTAIGLLFASHFRAYYRIDWPLALWWGLKDWYLWGALAPIVVWLTRRVPPSRERWPGALAVHLLAALSLALVHPTLVVLLSVPVEGLGEASFAGAVSGLFLKRYTLSFLTYGAVAGIALAEDAYRRDPGRRERALHVSEELRRGRAGADGGRAAERLLVRRDGRERFLEVARIDRIEAEGNYVRIHAGEDRFFERRTLKSLQAQLDPSRFLRVHRSHVVQVDRIDRIEPRFKGGYEVVLRDGTRLPLSRTYRRHLEDRVGESF